MKLFLHTPLLILLFLLLPIESKGQTKTELIIGTWALDYDMTLEVTDTDAKTAFKNVSQSHRMEIEKVFRDRRMSFIKDHTFKLQLADGRNSVGAWELNTTGDILKIKNEDASKVRTYRIHIITTEKLVVEETETKGKGYFEKLHFIKLNN